MQTPRNRKLRNQASDGYDFQHSTPVLKRTRLVYDFNTENSPHDDSLRFDLSGYPQALNDHS